MDAHERGLLQDTHDSTVRTETMVNLMQNTLVEHKTRMDEHGTRLDSLEGWRWTILGGASVLGTLGIWKAKLWNIFT